MSWHQTKIQRRSLQWWKNDSSYKILSPLLSASCNFTLHMLASPLSGGPPILGHSLMVRNTLPDSLISLLLSQALCRPVFHFFSGLCNTNHTSKTQLRGPYLPPVLSIHMLSMPGPRSLLLPLHHRVCNAFFWASSAVPPLFLWTSVTHSLPSLPYACYSFPKTCCVHQPTCPSLSLTQISSRSTFQTWLSSAAEQHSNFRLTTSHLSPPHSLIFLDCGSAYT